MHSPDSLMSSILIIRAGLASLGQLMPCDYTEKSGLDLQIDPVGLLFFSGFRLSHGLLSVYVILDQGSAEAVPSLRLVLYDSVGSLELLFCCRMK